jgi:signal transduction histidine kinase
MVTRPRPRRKGEPRSLRVEGSEEADHSGRSHDVGTLVARARDAGTAVRLEVTGRPVELPSAVDHSVYRLVQEALTNAKRYAGNAQVHVRVGYEPASVEVEVLDDGPGTGTRPGGGASGTVTGLFAKIGARDRAQAVIVAYEAGLATPGSPDPSL